MNPINRAIVEFVKLLPKAVVRKFANRYIAGESLVDGVRVVKELNSKGIIATMDVLGESVTNKDESVQAKKEYLEVLDAIEKHKLKSNISVKPTQMGLNIDREFCYEQIAELAERAKLYNNFVRIDMEDSSTTDDTFYVYRKLKEKYSNVGIVIQAYLKRTMDDIKHPEMKDANYRLCKGIYIEPEEIAYKGKEEIRKNFLRILEYLLDNGNYVGIATHDDFLVNKAYEMIKEKKLGKDKYEFQMLYGVKEKLRDRINSNGDAIRIYVPFGKHWYNYSIRRLQENPTVAWYITKSVFMPNTVSK
ncbi:L-proline dehydrogenase [Melioribacter roseus P3M-2]|uniref:proline dehydrogenase n=1 Tax=Melioribacter roseus (strain DSM 23840 / JCM 17771 / VKM B-2668 / P3M-2) TaxID=1191523 RepID=I6Z2C7_MELRP|nr:proline dehydrogenase family protein [Melioribacter roseus]AFN73305.1 L-proline dehydrogenase [Melioribacter roseus P3M-2]